MLKNLIILPDGTEVFSGNARDNAIISCEFSQFVNDGAELSIGSACCNELEVKLFAKNLLINANDEIKYYKVSGNGNRTKIGVFRCEKPTVTGTGTYKFVAYDRVSWLDKDLTDWLSSLNGWPYSVENFAKMVCEACGLTLAEKAIDYSFQIVGENLILTYSGDQPQYSIGNDGRLMLAYTGDVPDVSINENGHLVDESGGTPIELPNGSYQIRKFSGSGVTGRMLMQWLGQITCRFIRANADGEIEFAWYSDKGKEITTRGEFAYFGGGLSYEDFTVAEIQKVQIKASENDNGTVYPDGSEEELNTYKITGNYLLTAETGDELKPVARAIFEQLQGVTYTPCKVSIQATTEINAGDIVHITDRNGVTITTYVMSKTNKGQKDTLECTGSYKRDSSTATNTLTMKALNGKVLDIKKNVDGLRIENKDTAGKVAKLELTVDGLKTSVEDAEGDISKLEQSSKEITASVESVKKTSEDALKEAQKNATDLSNYANQVNGSLTDLQNQIDGAIETWFFSYEPKTTNAPASSWTTTEDKNKHLGDLFYIIDNKDKGGLVYRWALTNGVYGWVLVEDTEVAKALETASQAKDTADGKRRVFVTQPNPPYDVGDLWTNNTDLYVCQTARATGNYTASDWKLATEYTTEKAVKALIKVAEESITLQVQSVEKKVDGIEVGGRNLYLQSKTLENGADYWIGLNNWIKSGETYEGFAVYSRTGAWRGFAPVIDTKKGDIYTLSFYGKVTAGGTISSLHRNYALGNVDTGLSIVGGNFSFDVRWVAESDDGSAWKRYWATVEVTEDDVRLHWRIENRRDVGTISICGLKLEKGNRPTDWTPAPEDVDGEISEVKEEISTLKVTSKGVDMVSEDSNGKLVSFIGNRDTGGVWEAKYTKNGAVTSALYFDFAANEFVFTGAIKGGSININDRFKVDSNGNVTLPSGTSITWGMLPSSVASTGEIPTSVSELTNDSGYQTSTQVESTITGKGYQTASQVTTITENTIATTNVVAQYLHVNAANIDGILEFGDGAYYIAPNRTDGIYLSLPGLEVDSDGATFDGAIYASSGKIGEWSIDESLKYITTDAHGRSHVTKIGVSGATFNAGYGSSHIGVSGASFTETSAVSGGNYARRDVGLNYSGLLFDFASYAAAQTFDSHFNVGFSSGAYIQYTAVFGSGNKWVSSRAELVGTWLGTSSQAITSDAGKKHDILDLDERYMTLFDLIRPVAYKYNDGTSGRYHTGFIANEVEEALEKAGIDTQEFAGFVTIDEKNEDGTIAKTRCLRYEEFIAILWSKVKQLEKRLEYAAH